MERNILNDAQWAKMEPHCLGKPTDPGRSGRDNRLFMEAVLWIVTGPIGSFWQDLTFTGGKLSDLFWSAADSAEFDGPWDLAVI